MKFKINIYPGIDIDKLREANDRLRIQCKGKKLTIEAKCSCEDCGEPMADGGACGYYCTKKGCSHDKFPTKKKPKKPVLTVDVTRCLRCGKDHQRLGFTPFKKKSITGFNYWASCPVTGEPLLLGNPAEAPELFHKVQGAGHHAMESE